MATAAAAACAAALLAAPMPVQAQAAAPTPQPLPRCPASSGSFESAVQARVPTPALEPPPSADTPIEISTDDALLGVDGDALLSGNVRVAHGNRHIEADNVEYDAEALSIKVRGAVRYEDPVLRARGSSGEYAQGGAQLEGAEFELRERPGRGSATRLALSPEGVVELEQVSFSTCPADEPDWQIRARRIALDTRDRNGTGRNAQIQFKGVPLLYLPYISFPLGSQRKSGFLFPSLGHTMRSGLQLTVPYYLNLAPNYDLTLTPSWYGRRGLDLAGQFRYLAPAQRGDLTFNLLPTDQIADRDRHYLRLAHRTDLWSDWRFTVEAEDVSDTAYFEDFSTGPQGSSTAFLERLARLTYRDQHWWLRGEVQHFQTINEGLAAEDRPYTRLPRLLARGDWSAGPARRLSYGFDAELVNFDREVGVTGWRFDATPTIGLDLSNAGVYLRPQAGYRYTRYALDGLAPGADDAPQRALPFAAIDAGLVLERDAGQHAQRRMTLEPRLLYLYTPYREQSALPVFDTGIPDLNLVQLFGTNRYVGADRVSNANQASIGLTAKLFDAQSGTRFLAATVGQTFYFEHLRVGLPGEPPRRGNESDLVAELALTAYKHWNIDLGLQWNPQDSERERSQLRLQYRPDDSRVVNFSYRQQRDRLEQADVSAAWPVAKRWNLYARWTYDLQDSTTLERFAGLEYRACCWRLRTVARRFVSSRTGERDTALYLQLELNGLASVGSSADAFLEEAIRGYSFSAVNR
ncbi:MAG: LPS assembly protein LptD [Steroidobacteraceae bacterium]|nr:LPS assembly protein LptD [Nevskiaceae bacterium]MCP5360512.1 LPS assembly protein LptD [Nevskiaceae bacterium]MCP5472858.1 LPS assembly protein LptD [Nevskiaceae bacterium]